MPGLILWKNREINRLRKDMDRLFARLWDDFHIPFYPKISREDFFLELSETEETLILKAEIPGIRPEEIDISLSEDTLFIKGNVKEDVIHCDEEYRNTERRYCYFSRTIQLPCKINAGHAMATYKDGILNVVMPKWKSEKVRGVKIEIA